MYSFPLFVLSVSRGPFYIFWKLLIANSCELRLLCVCLLTLHASVCAQPLFVFRRRLPSLLPGWTMYTAYLLGLLRDCAVRSIYFLFPIVLLFSPCKSARDLILKKKPNNNVGSLVSVCYHSLKPSLQRRQALVNSSVFFWSLFYSLFYTFAAWWCFLCLCHDHTSEMDALI